MRLRTHIRNTWSWTLEDDTTYPPEIVSSSSRFETRAAALADLRAVCAALGCEVPEIEEPPA